MNRFARLIIISSLILVMTISLLFLTVTKNVRFTTLSNGIHHSLAPVQSMLSKPIRYLSDQKDQMMDLFSAYEENKILKQSLFSLERQAAENVTLRKENDSFRHQLEIRQQYPDKEFQSAFVITRSSDAWMHQIMIDQGEVDGIFAGNLVLANGGLIGLVTEVYDDHSVVKLLTHSDEFTKIPIKLMIEHEEVYGILSDYDTESNSFIISQLNSVAAIPSGTTVVTSDLAGKTPSNIQVGKVRFVKSSSSDFNRKIFVEPTANFSNLHSVLVVKQ